MSGASDSGVTGNGANRGNGGLHAYASLDDERLVILAQNGHEAEAFTTLYERYFDRICAYARVRLGGDWGQAQDVAQEAFASLASEIRGLEVGPEKPLRPWLFTVAYRRVVDVVRDRSRFQLEPPEEIDERQERLDEPLGDGDIDVDRLADIDLRCLLTRLTKKQRTVIWLVYIERLSIEETAATLGEDLEAVRSRRDRAMSRLRQEAAVLDQRAHPDRRERRAPMLVRVRLRSVLASRRFALWGNEAVGGRSSVRAAYRHTRI